MTIPWVTIGKYSAVALSSSCLAAGICFATHDRVAEGEQEELPDLPPEPVKEDITETRENPQQTIEKLTKVKLEAERKNYVYMHLTNCYKQEQKRLKEARVYNSNTWIWQEKRDEKPRFDQCDNKYNISFGEKA